MPTILIVDDDDAICAILYDLLSVEYECDTARVAEEALQYLKVESYDAILTDISMPGLSGVELLKRVKENGCGTPVILISGKGCELDPQALMDLGAFAYVNKPFNLDEIEGVVERALEQRTASGVP